MIGRGPARLTFAVLAGLLAVGLGLAGNVAADQERWPWKLDLIRLHPWLTVSMLILFGAVIQVILWARSAEDSEQESPASESTPVGAYGVAADVSKTSLASGKESAGPATGSPAHSLTNEGSGEQGVSNLPPRTATFTGRDELLQQLPQRLNTGRPVAVHALHGWGGVGKTTLAAEYAHRFADGYRIAWWVDAERPDLIGEQLAALGVAAGWVSHDTPSIEAVGAVRRRLRDSEGWLIVLDNATTPAEVRDWLPQGRGHVIVTSRYPNWEQVAVSIPVNVFTRSESVALLRRLAVGIDTELADQISDRLGDLPLAITQAGGFLAETGVGGLAYLEELAQHAERVMAYGEAVGYPRSLASVISISVERVNAEDPAAVQLVQLCAMLAPEPVPLDLLLTPASAAKLRSPLKDSAMNTLTMGTCVARLGRYGLVKPSHDGPILHRLTQAIIRDQLDARARSEMSDLAERLLVAAAPGNPDDPAKWSAWARLVPHLFALDPGASASAGIRRMANDATWYLLARGDVAAASVLADQLRTAWQAILGDDDPDSLLAAFDLAATYSCKGDHFSSYQLNKDTLERMRRVFGEDHLYTLNTANSLADNLRDVGRQEEALTMHEDTLARKRRVLGDDHPHTLLSALNVANILRGLGRPKEALPMNEETLGRYRRVLGDDFPHTFYAAESLARTLCDVGRLDEALTLDEDTLARRRRILGDDHPDTFASATNLARTLRRLGRATEAEALEEALINQTVSNSIGTGHLDSP